jgi:hypothetical protein
MKENLLHWRLLTLGAKALDRPFSTEDYIRITSFSVIFLYVPQDEKKAKTQTII